MTVGAVIRAPTPHLFDSCPAEIKEGIARWERQFDAGGRHKPLKCLAWPEDSDSDFVAADLDFVARGLDFVASGFGNRCVDLEIVASRRIMPRSKARRNALGGPARPRPTSLFGKIAGAKNEHLARRLVSVEPDERQIGEIAFEELPSAADLAD